MKIDPAEPCPCGSGEPYGECHGVRKEEQPITQTIPLKVVPEPDPGTRAVFQGVGEEPLLFRATENSVAYTCGTCDAPLILGIDISRIVDIVLGCSNCGSFNESVPRDSSA